MAAPRILLEEAIGATRAIALDESGLVCALYLDLWSQRSGHARLGGIYEARLRTIAPKQGGGYLELGGGAGEAFLRLPRDHKLTEGAALCVRIASEARREKLPRAVIDEGAHTEASCFQRWRDSLHGPGPAPVEHVESGNAEIDAAFDAALTPAAPLPGGGALRLSPTPALCAIDVDTAGREESGRAARRAHCINLDAARETARQLHLRRLGGLAVLDCVAPLGRDAGKEIKAAFLESWRSLSGRKAEALPPSPYGLMQIKLEWGETPLAEVLLDDDGKPTGEALALAGLRRLEREARSTPMAQLNLHLPERAYDWFRTCGLNLQAAIDERFGARISVTKTNAISPDVTQR